MIDKSSLLAGFFAGLRIGARARAFDHPGAVADLYVIPLAVVAFMFYIRQDRIRKATSAGLGLTLGAAFINQYMSSLTLPVEPTIGEAGLS